jgi:epoxide hydrolase
MNITPFQIAIPQAELDDLKKRLDATRFPERVTVADQSQGSQLEHVRKLVDYWRTQYDWRRIESRLNGYPQFKTEIDGLGIHFLHIRSKHEDAQPMVMTHAGPVPSLTSSTPSTRWSIRRRTAAQQRMRFI